MGPYLEDPCKHPATPLATTCRGQKDYKHHFEVFLKYVIYLFHRSALQNRTLHFLCSENFQEELFGRSWQLPLGCRTPTPGTRRAGIICSAECRTWTPRACNRMAPNLQKQTKKATTLHTCGVQVVFFTVTVVSSQGVGCKVSRSAPRVWGASVRASCVLQLVSQIRAGSPDCRLFPDILEGPRSTSKRIDGESILLLSEREC